MSHSFLVENLYSLWWIILSAMIAPIFALITRRFIPDVIWLLIFGIVIGPHILGLSELTESIEIIRELGMGFLFLLAGFEVNTSDMRNKQGKQALLTWFISFLSAIVISFLFTNGNINISIVIAIACTSTALGTLLPILKDSKIINSNLGKATITHGAYGELLPIIAMSLLLSTFATWQASIILISFSIISIIVVTLPIRFIRKTPLLGKAILSASNTTMQTTLRMTVFSLITLMLLTAVLKLDIALGAFLAGILLNVILKAFSPKQGEEIAHKVEIVGFSFLIPVFFITSGMNINLLKVLENWQLVLVLFAFIAIIRGVIVYLRERFTNTHSNLNNKKEQLALSLYSATGLPIIVAVAGIAETSNIITPAMSGVLVMSGALTVLIFPLIANLILRQNN
ncbi:MULTISPECIES: cation:proton antiporter [Staphylococcus]|jgi:Kef-type K+ transport system membrane component KefB|uniref:Cation/H+ exchanger transmembrane domain-containing protein n=2 Tax=Staphylococcus TaxID=1279 RepID=A0A077RGZ8_STAXY|nr:MULTISPECIES: cation:proton antiporter [Staphylococcus]MDW8564349.1 cation:proton antiporter [Staphylococcus shinii]MDW8567580.1 cation:proton antiporter [Staphylococcus shinii]MEB7753268.1 cation:proton antiporter [Staphylococcus pseudoxylosus]MEC5301029.1 cation:proton antiporter [Staphylococcus shinii]PTI07117.1 potassium transporter Kef [Staphylococcus xylosus]